MTTCTETRRDIRKAFILETVACLRRLNENLEFADPAVDQDLRMLLEVAQHAEKRVARNAEGALR